MHTISKVAEKVGLTAYTLRYYEKEGLLPEIEKNPQGVRIYTDDNIIWIELVKCLKDTGMPISEIKKIVALSLKGEKTIPERRDILMAHRQAVANQIEQLQQMMTKIDRKIEWYDDPHKSCD